MSDIYSKAWIRIIIRLSLRSAVVVILCVSLGALTVHCLSKKSLMIRCKSATEREALLRRCRRGLVGQIPDLAGAVCFLAGVCSSRLLIPSEVLVTLPPPPPCVLIKHAESICLASSGGSDCEHTQAADWFINSDLYLGDDHSVSAVWISIGKGFPAHRESSEKLFLTGFAAGPGFYIGHGLTQHNKSEISLNTFPVTFTLQCGMATWSLYIWLFYCYWM